MKKWIIFLLALSLLLSLAGCSGGEAAPEASGESQEETVAPEEDTASQETEDPIAQVVAAFSAYPADAVVLRIGDREITWDVYYYVLGNYLSSFLYQLGSMPETFDVDIGGMTMDAYLRQMAEQYLCYCVGISLHSEGIADEEQLRKTLEEDWVAVCENNGGEEAMEQLMAENCKTRHSFEFFSRNQLEAQAVQTSLYGEGGSDLTPEQLTSWAEEQGLVRCKHILLLTNGEDMTEEEKAAARETMEGFLGELRQLVGDEKALEARFDELMQANSQDTGLQIYPDGYVFARGEMVQEFEDAAFALEDYALSQVVETDYGYHILLRLPMESGIIADLDQNTYRQLELQEMAADDLFMELCEEWRQELTVELCGEFQELTLNRLLLGK